MYVVVPITKLVGGFVGVFMILLLVIGITCDITKRTIKRMNKKESSSSTDPHDTGINTSIDLRIMIPSDIFLIFIHMITLLFQFLFTSNDLECRFMAISGIMLLHITRCIMYLIFVRRVQVIYEDTLFALSRLSIYILYGILALYSIPYIFYIDWNFLNATYDQQFGCLIQYQSVILFAIFAILDILIAVYCLIVFVYPLHRVISQQEDKQMSSPLYNVMIKYSILCSTAICSTFILMSAAYIFEFGYYYSMIDDLINGMLLILLHPIHNTCYKRMCCPLHLCCIRCCGASKEDKVISRSPSPKPPKPPKQRIIILNEEMNTETERRTDKQFVADNVTLSSKPKKSTNIPQKQISTNNPGLPSMHTTDIREMMKIRIQRKLYTHSDDTYTEYNEYNEPEPDGMSFNLSSTHDDSLPFDESGKQQIDKITSNYSVRSKQTNPSDEHIISIILEELQDEVERDANIEADIEAHIGSLKSDDSTSSATSKTLKFIHYESSKL